MCHTIRLHLVDGSGVSLYLVLAYDYLGICVMIFYFLAWPVTLKAAGSARALQVRLVGAVVRRTVVVRTVPPVRIPASIYGVASQQVHRRCASPVPTLTDR